VWNADLDLGRAGCAGRFKYLTYDFQNDATPVPVGTQVLLCALRIQKLPGDERISPISEGRG